MDVQDKVVIITGASEGIGLATAHVFASEGAKLALAARSADKLSRLTNELREQHHEAIAIPADMTKKADIDAMVNKAYQQYGRIDVLINNAGQGMYGRVEEVNEDNFRKMFELNVIGPLLAMQAVIPKMRQGGGGLIINVSSQVSKMQIPGIGAYAATKAALNMLSDTARVELGSDNIRIVTMYPGRTATNFGKNALDSANTGQRTPGQAPGAPQPDSAEEVAEKILQAAQNEPHDQYMRG